MTEFYRITSVENKKVVVLLMEILRKSLPISDLFKNYRAKR